MRSAHATSTTRNPQPSLRDRLQLNEDLRTRLRQLLRTGGSACGRTLPEVLQQRTGAFRRGG